MNDAWIPFLNTQGPNKVRGRPRLLGALASSSLSGPVDSKMLAVVFFIFIFLYPNERKFVANKDKVGPPMPDQMMMWSIIRRRKYFRKCRDRNEGGLLKFGNIIA